MPVIPRISVDYETLFGTVYFLRKVIATNINTQLNYEKISD